MRLPTLAALLGIAATSAPALAAGTCDAFGVLANYAQAWPLAASVTSVVSKPAVGTTPAYCEVTGKIPPVAGGFDINFRIALPAPAAWNQKALQIGGSGFDGSIPNLTVNPGGPAAPPATHLARGFANFADDGGHVGPSSSGAFMLNDEAFENFAHAHLKKTHDVAHAIIETAYGRKIRRSYFYGSSGGGREALIVAQRYPDDYDGVIVLKPVLNWTATFLRYIHDVRQVFAPGQVGWLSPAKNQLVGSAETAACDALDGIVDGVISNWHACRFDPQALRCPTGTDMADTCLSDEQIRTVRQLHIPYGLPFSLAHGVRSSPRFLHGGKELADGLAFWLTGNSFVTPGTAFTLGNEYVKHGIVRNAEYDVALFNVEQHRQATRAASRLVDATDPDLTDLARGTPGHGLGRYHERGGKLILWQGMADLATSPLNAVNYYKAVVDDMGQRKVDNFVRFYTSPHISHFFAGPANAPSFPDLLPVLDDWVETRVAPGTLEASRTTPANGTQSRPMCLYPNYPHYQGGNASLSTSYRCMAAQGHSRNDD